MYLCVCVRVHGVCLCVNVSVCVHFKFILQYVHLPDAFLMDLWPYEDATGSPDVLLLYVEAKFSTSLISVSRDSKVVLPCFCSPTSISFKLSLAVAL